MLILLVIENQFELCIPITFNNPLKSCFSNNKYHIKIQARPTQIVKVYFLLKKRFLMDFLS